jgi:hypothetical protein
LEEVFHLTSPCLSRKETPEKYKIRLLKIQRGYMPEKNIIRENNNNLFLSYYFNFK